MTRHTVLVASLVFAAAPLAAQPSAVSGTVVDQSGAGVRAAMVTLAGRDRKHITSTGNRSDYRFADVVAGRYEVVVSRAGFASTRTEVLVNAGQEVAVPPIVLSLAMVGETIVVTAARKESTVVDAPASMTVVEGSALAVTPSQNLGEALRSVPGLNVIQTSARDVNLTSRQSTSTIATSQLALVDGRSIYSDFFGMVLWDVVPVAGRDIKQIEIVSGPASAVWGANAMAGVVNIITKTARETAGRTSVALSGGGFDRDAGSTVGSGPGASFGVDLSTSIALGDRWSYRLSAAYARSEAYSRPVGSVPVIADPRDPSGAATVGGAPYPLDTAGPFGAAFPNTGTRQPKVNLRVDQELAHGRVTYSAGIAGTSGTIHTGIGPFDIQPGSRVGYGMVTYKKGAFTAHAYANLTNGDAPNLLVPDPATGGPLQLRFDNRTFDLEASHTRAVGGRQVVSYGGNYRRNSFDITLMPGAPVRHEVGGYVQDEVLAGRWRFSLGARLDRFGNIERAVFSPRLAVMFKPSPTQSLRVSFNRAFRSPSTGNNYLDIALVSPVDLSGLAPLLPPGLRPLVAEPFPLTVRAVGSEPLIGTLARPSLRPESLTAYEVGYTAVIGRTTVSAAAYVNDLDDSIELVELAPTVDPYTSSNPPPGWPLPPIVLDGLGQAGVFLPRTAFTYANLGPLRQRGLELSVDHRIRNDLAVFANYSWQGQPQIRDAATPYPFQELNLPPTNRFNAGLTYDGARLLGGAWVNHTDQAFWSDVLTSAYHGYSGAFTLVNASLGVKWSQGRLVTSVKCTNLLNQTIQQHVFGDLVKRSVMGELRLAF